MPHCSNFLGNGKCLHDCRSISTLTLLTHERNCYNVNQLPEITNEALKTYGVVYCQFKREMKTVLFQISEIVFTNEAWQKGLWLLIIQAALKLSLFFSLFNRIGRWWFLWPDLNKNFNRIFGDLSATRRSSRHIKWSTKMILWETLHYITNKNKA